MPTRGNGASEKCRAKSEWLESKYESAEIREENGVSCIDKRRADNNSANPPAPFAAETTVI